MHYSGILVALGPGDPEAHRRRLEALPGVALHAEYAAGRRLIVTLETATVGEQQDGLRAIGDLPDVAAAHLVCHVIDEPPAHAATEAAGGRA